ILFSGCSNFRIVGVSSGRSPELSLALLFEKFILLFLVGPRLRRLRVKVKIGDRHGFFSYNVLLSSGKKFLKSVWLILTQCPAENRIRFQSGNSHDKQGFRMTRFHVLDSVVKSSNIVLDTFIIFLSY
ncbi:Unknown protein, partial [Striga hermonthica]